MTRIHSYVVAALTALAATAGTTYSPPAQALGCNVASRVTGLAALYVQPNAALRAGPKEACAIQARAPGDHWASFYRDCWIRNDAGNIWWFGSFYKNGTMRYGWMWDGNLHRQNISVTEQHRCFPQ